MNERSKDFTIRTLAIDAPIPWHCRHCGALLGHVEANKLLLGGVAVLASTVICPRCSHTREFVTKKKGEALGPTL